MHTQNTLSLLGGCSVSMNDLEYITEKVFLLEAKDEVSFYTFIYLSLNLNTPFNFDFNSGRVTSTHEF